MAIRLFALCLCLHLLLPLPAKAGQTTLRVSFNSFPPWKALDENGDPDGIEVAFIKLLAKRLSLDIAFIPLPFKRGLKMLEYGEVDAMIGVLRRPDRQAYAYFLEPPYQNKTHKAFYVLKGKEASITRYENLHSLVIGTQLGSKYFPRFDSDTAIQKVAVSDTGLNIKMLLAGRIDAFIATETLGDYRISRLGLTNRIGKARYVYRKKQDVYIALARCSPLANRLAEFNNAMRNLVEQGEFERIKNEFLSNMRH